MVALAAAGILLFQKTPAPTVVAPSDPAKLEPQLRDYISSNVVWAQAEPRHADRHATLGIVYAVNGLWKEARESFQIAAALDHNQPLAAMYVGVSDQELGDLESALKTFREVTVRFPQFAPGFYRLGYALSRAGKIDEADQAYRRLLLLAPNEWRGYAGRGELLMRKGQYEVAVPLLKQAVQLDFGARSVHHMLGQALQSLGQTNDAKFELLLGRNGADSPMPDDWSKTASQHVRLLQEQVQSATEFAEAGEAPKAVEILALALAYHPENLSLVNQMAIALNRANQPRQACALLKRALQKSSNFVPGLVTLSLCQQALDENEQALATAERVIALAPNIAQGYVAKANALLAKERDNDALDALQSAERCDPQNAEILMQMGDILWRNLNRLGDAKSKYERARDLDPGLVPVHVRLGDLYLHLGDLDDARSSISWLRRLSPASPELSTLEEHLKRQEKR